MGRERTMGKTEWGSARLGPDRRGPTALAFGLPGSAVDVWGIDPARRLRVQCFVLTPTSQLRPLRSVGWW
jgi:hypothetical protein